MSKTGTTGGAAIVQRRLLVRSRGDDVTVAVMVFARDRRLADPTGAYVRRYVPELARLPAAVIHDPDEPTRRARGYPPPIVDHRQAIAAHQARRH